MIKYNKQLLIKIELILLLQASTIIPSSAQTEKNITAQYSGKNITASNLDFSGKKINNSIRQIDSVANSSTFASPFCQVYSNTMKNIELQIRDNDSSMKAFIKKFEIAFADYFLRALVNYNNKNLSPLSEWKCFFDNHKANSWQTVLLGVNTHTNIDMWQTLTNNFTEQEIKFYKKPLLKTHLSIAKVYDSLFYSIKSQSSYLRFINLFTIGYAKKFGERKVYKWRKRNVNLAILYYRNKERFTRRLVIVIRKKNKIDQRILSYKS